MSARLGTGADRAFSPWTSQSHGAASEEARMWTTVVQPPRSGMTRAATEGEAATTQRRHRHPARPSATQADGGDLQHL